MDHSPQQKKNGGHAVSDQQQLPQCHTWATQLLCYQWPTVAFRGLSEDGPWPRLLAMHN
jgi:hypothetical protein